MAVVLAFTRYRICCLFIFIRNCITIAQCYRKHHSPPQFCQGGATQVRFQPRLGRMLAAATENFVSIFDVETQVCRLKLQVGCRLS